MRIMVDCNEVNGINLMMYYRIRNRFGLSSRFMGKECLEIAKTRGLTELALFSADESRMYID